MDMEDSKSSSEESYRLEQSNDDAGTGRSYKCVFCKRGFTTAQALGGHMNIHRKDKPKPRPNSSVPSISNKSSEDYVNCGAFPPIEIFPSHYPSPHEVRINYQPYFPAPTCDGRSQHAQQTDNSYVQIAHHLNPFTEGWPRSLSLQIDPSNSQIIENGEDGRKDELDLELRLGYHQ